ncbi:hypothetical protein [Fusibacter sp. 3D3]|uniref:hypothetical protein n=1 Tax=Fusibacter sp. 3D3 TaxID=1048380 RepID=UPI00085372A5|nr:hypothetical protein [Fusibacter sp. 3D3]GAU79210.1 hypothetical protein F3D3_3868 [Fusibacter sp. 3D3]
MYLEKTSVLSGDDLINEIPDGVGEEPVIISENRWGKTDLKVIEDFTDSADIYEYVDDIATDTTFTFRIDGIDSANYSITSTTSNSITIKCINYYYTGLLVGINNRTSEETSIPLTLKGLF